MLQGIVISEDGQTLVEVLVALMLVIFFLSGIVVIELYAIRNIEFAQKKSMATKLAREQLERARTLRDSAGIEMLENYCQSSACYINSFLTPVPSPALTGIYSQTVQLVSASSEDCSLPEITITPPPVSYKATAVVSWGSGVATTPAPQVEISSCLTVWR